MSRIDHQPGPHFRLSVLDQAPVPEGASGGDALRNSIDLARLAESLGYHRYWLAEHHGTPGLACTSPEIMIGQIAAATRRIRVGSGGVMLPHYSPLKVAENFSMLSGLFPGRIDLGIGRAAGTDASTSFALQRDRRQRSPDDFPDQLDELLGYIGNRRSTHRPFAARVVLPGRPDKPEPWLLGSSAQSAVWAAELGLPYCFADFINAAGAPIAAHYRDTFVAGERGLAPELAVAVWVICADEDEEAADLAASFRMMMALMLRGQLIAVPPPQKAQEFFDADPAAAALSQHRRVIAGSPQTVKRSIEAVVEEYGAQEVLLVNILYDHLARRRSYELVAEAFGIGAPTALSAQR
jgi:luciferase family oxidoreductase group 1